MYKIRISIGAVLLSMLVGIYFLDRYWHGNIASTAMISLFATWGLAEFYQMMGRREIKPYRLYGVCSVFVFFLLQGHALLMSFSGVFLFLALLGLFLLMLADRQPAPLIILNGAVTILGFVYLGLLGYFIRLIHLFPQVEQGLLATLYLMLVAKGADIGGYLVGKRFGRHKLFPRISPKKSWEGTCGGVLLSMTISYLMVQHSVFLQVWLNWPMALLLGLILAVLSLVGDLAESLLKRGCEVKDSNHLIPEFGGILDLLDSLIFVAPAGFYFFNLACVGGG